MTLYERAYGRSRAWKGIGVALGILTATAATEWFVTYCVFSNKCPAAEKIGDWPLSRMIDGAGPN